MPLRRVCFSAVSVSKMGIDFAHFGLKSGMVFEETKEVYERIINKKKREICEFEFAKRSLKNLFSWRSYLTNDDIIP